jgi:hypothetical protein
MMAHILSIVVAINSVAMMIVLCQLAITVVYIILILSNFNLQFTRCEVTVLYDRYIVYAIDYVCIWCFLLRIDCILLSIKF